MALSAEEKERIMQGRETERSAGMNRLTAIINGKRATVITPLSRAECAASCRDRFGARFQGLEDEPTTGRQDRPPKAGSIRAQQKAGKQKNT